MRSGWCWPVLIVGWLAAATAFADTRRVAVVIGNNAGSGAQPPLRYAETDAGKMARVLTELGGVRTADLFLLQGRSIAALKQTLTLARQRVAAYQADPANRVILVFYFSGHSDGEALEVVTELTADSRALVALQPGRYAVRAWRDGRVFAGRVTVAAGEKRQVRWEELAAMVTSAPRAKGAPHGARLEASDRWRDARSFGRPILQLAAGGQRGVADALGLATSVRVGVRSASSTGLSFAANVSTGTGDRFRETSALLFGGYRFGLDREAFQAWAGLELGGGAIVQSLTAGSSSATPALALAPMAGLSLRVAGPVAVTLEGHLPATLLTRDGGPAMILLPAAWLGLLVSL